MNVNKHRPRNTNHRFTLLKRKAEDQGIPYSSARDAHFRGELPVLKIGKNERYQRWYVTDPDWDKWIETRRVG